jgi:endonuclease VIII
MEGPSLFLAKEQLKPFKKKKVVGVSGNTTIDKQRFEGQTVKDIFSWGKHLLFQFDGFALKVHFLLFGTFSAVVEGKSVTGDYKPARVPRLAFAFENGQIEMYNCSVKIIEHARLKTTYDFAADIMSRTWDSALAYGKITKFPNAEIGDVLLDQNIFGGVGNIIKNEILSLARMNAKTTVRDLSRQERKKLIGLARSFSKQFYKWRKQFVLRLNLKIHRKGVCPHCGGKVVHVKTGSRNRWSHFCPVCQKLRSPKSKIVA